MSSSDQQFLAATRDAGNLDGRLKSNERFAKRDLNEWILSFVRIGEGDRVLDVCCGTGKQLVAYARLAGSTGEVHGLDASSEALAQVRRTLPPDTGRVVLHQGYLEQIRPLLSAFDGHFDWITCSYGIYYSKDPKQTVQELKHLLKPSGRLVVVGPARKNNDNFYALIRRVAKLPEFVVYSSTTFMDETLIPECSRLFRDVQMFQFDNEMIYPDAESVITYWKSCGTYYDESAVPQLRRLLEEHFRDHREFRMPKQALGVVCSDG